MYAFEVKSNKTDYPILVIAKDYEAVLQTLEKEMKIYSCNIERIIKLNYVSSHILVDGFGEK